MLERATVENIEHLLRPLPHDQYLFYCGVVYACRRLSELPETVLAKASELKEYRNARERIAHESAQAERLAFLNTPWWDSYIRDSASRNGEPSPEPGTDLG